MYGGAFSVPFILSWRISIKEINYAIRWIVIYPVDSAIQRLNNWGQVSIFISDHGKSWRIAGNITQRGSFEPDESQVVLQFLQFYSFTVSS